MEQMVMTRLPNLGEIYDQKGKIVKQVLLPAIQFYEDQAISRCSL